MLDGSTVDVHGPAVGPVNARQELDAGALASTVLAQEREHVTRKQVERPVRESDGAAEALRGGTQAGRRDRFAA